MAEKTKKEDTKEPKVEASTTGLVHVDTFLETARVLYDLTNLQVAGFKGYMQGNFYQVEDKDFIPYLEKYLGKGE